MTSHKKFLPFFIYRTIKFLLNKTYFGYILGKTSGRIWDEAESSLLEYNKTIITLSSSAIILSFSVSQISKFPINRSYIIASWIAFLIVIFLAIVQMFLNFLYKLTRSLLMKESEEKNLNGKGVWDRPDVKKFFELRAYMFFIVILELLFFFIGFIMLIASAISFSE